MQIFLLYEGCKIPLYKVYLLRYTSVYTVFFSARPGLPQSPLAIDLGTDLLVMMSAWLGFYLIRRGLFRPAVFQFVLAMVASSLVSYASFGYLIWNADLVSFETLALSGLMLGRKALWWIYPAFMLNYAIGMTADYFHNPRVLHSSSAYDALFSLVLSYFVVVIILDRSSSALRQSLVESNRHRRQLQREMAEREQAQEQLLQAQKMDAVGKLASGIAHDFNNVLGIIQGFALERHRLDEPGAARSADAQAMAIALQGVEMAARRGASVSRKLLNFSRRGVTHIETFDAAGTIRELQPLLRQLLPPQVRLRIDTPGLPLPIDFDRHQFELALLNLASNARDAMPDGGELSLVAAPVEPSGVCITVRDTGMGMPEEVRRRIFDPFYTTKPPDSGTGLGLTVVYTLVEHAGGRIEVDTVPGAGTRFRIRLPRAGKALSGTVPLPAHGTVHVLLIDDDDDLRALLCTALESGGCKVSSAATGAEAERLAMDGAATPQVLVCDNRLPDTDGHALLPRLRRYLPRVSVVLISACLGAEGQSPDSSDPLVEHLPKPFSPNELVARVHGAAARQSQTGEVSRWDQTMMST